MTHENILNRHNVIGEYEKCQKSKKRNISLSHIEKTEARRLFLHYILTDYSKMIKFS
jgi:hypothetical protein